MRGGRGGRLVWRIGLFVVATALAMSSCAPLPLVPATVRVPPPLFEPATAQPRSVASVPTPRVLIIGDSLADQHGSHAAVALREVGVDVRVASWWGWGLFSRQQYDMGGPIPLDQQRPDTMMRGVIEAVDDFDPDVIAFYSNHNYWPPYPRDAAGAPIDMGTPAFTQMVQAQLLVLLSRITAHGAEVLLVEPAPLHGRTSADNAIWQAYSALQPQLGFGMVDAGDRVADHGSGRWTATLPDCAGHPQPVRPDDQLHLTYFGAGLMGTSTARSIADALGISLKGGSAPADAPAAMLPAEDGYRLVSCDGATFSFGPFTGTLGGAAQGGSRPGGDPVVAAVPSRGSKGAWLVTDSSRVLALGTATPLVPRTDADVQAVERLGHGRHAVGIASTGTGDGYWVADSSGQVLPVGDADDLGGLDDLATVADGTEHVVAMSGTHDHDGYWLLTDTGRIAAFGSAEVHGDLQGAVAAPLVALAGHPSDEGYWVLDAAGGVHPFGVAEPYGSAAGQDMLRVVDWEYPQGFVTAPVPAAEAPSNAVAMVPTLSGNGYWIGLDSGAVCHFGDAGVFGGVHRAHINFSMRLLGVPFYGPGACSQSLDDTSAELDTLGDVETQDLPLQPD
jgi:hypothetical protein